MGGSKKRGTQSRRVIYKAFFAAWPYSRNTDCGRKKEQYKLSKQTTIENISSTVNHQVSK